MAAGGAERLVAVLGVEVRMPEVHATQCRSCGNSLPVKGSTEFLCPSCGEVLIGRCPRCRDQSVVYHCPKCNFEGP